MTTRFYTTTLCAALLLTQSSLHERVHAETLTTQVDGDRSCLVVEQPSVEGDHDLEICGDLTRSAEDLLEHQTQYKLHDDQSFQRRTVIGAAQLNGEVDFGVYPVSLSGSGVVDIDANQDEITIFDEGHQGLSDLQLAAEGEMRVVYQRGDLELDLEIGQQTHTRDNVRHQNL